jgi:hypothetical protein
MGKKTSKAARAAVPLACLLGAAAVFFACRLVSPVYSSLALALYFLALACAYDLKYLRVPEWLLGAMMVAGALYHAGLYTGLLAPSVELGLLPKYFSPAQFFLTIAVVGALIAVYFGSFLTNFLAGCGIRIGEHDLGLFIGIALLVPIRQLPNLPGGAVLFIPSVMLNSLFFGIFVALAVYVVYRLAANPALARMEKPPNPGPHGHRIRPRAVSNAVLGALCVAAFWTVAGRVLIPFPSLSWLGLAGVWVLIISGSLLLFWERVPFPAGLVNSLLVMFYARRFIPLPGNLWFVMLPFAVLAILSLLTALLSLVDAGLPSLGIRNRGFPLVPAIIFGLLVSVFFGDLFLSWLIP